MTEDTNASPRYIGNLRTAEVHDTENSSPLCKIEQISEENRVYFTTLEAAQALNYDGCAHCLPDHHKR